MSLPNPGPIAVRAAADAEANIGVTEQGDNNRGKWVETYLAAVHAEPGDPWCAAFVVYRLVTAAHELNSTIQDDFPRSAWTPDLIEWGKHNGLFIPAHDWALSQRGDIAGYYFPAKGRIAHVGLVTHGSANPFTDVEGNTSKPGGGVARDGDGVWEKQRTAAMLGELGGFVRLPF